MTDETGRHGESIVSAMLREKGWRILKKNFRTRRGEVDIIGDDGKDLVFVEVKTWRTMGPSSLEYAIGREKQKRIIGVAKAFLAINREFCQRTVRFDVVYINDLSGEFEHIEGAFETRWDV